VLVKAIALSLCLFSSAAGLAIITPANANVRLHGNGLPSIQFSHVPLGGGGAVIGVSSVPSANLLLAKTDQYGCYKSVSNSQWVQLDTVAAMPNDGVAVLTSAGAPIANGADECVADPSNINNIWMGTNGSLYFSSNGGVTFSTTTYPAQGASAAQGQNQAIKAFGHTIAVDPNNSNIVYASTPSNGLYFSTNQTTFSQISTSSIPTASVVSGTSAGGGHLIAFDTSGGTLTGASCPNSVSPCTAIVYATSYGNGVYKSTNAGVTWAIQNSTGMPTTHLYMVSDNHGDLYYIDNANVSAPVAWKYNGSNTWTSLSGSIRTPTSSVAVDPNNCSSASTCHIVFMVGGGNSTQTCYSVGGTTWACASGAQSYVSTDVPWIATWAAGFGLFPGGLAFDNSGHVYFGSEGVYFTTPPTSGGAAITFTSQTLGIEEALTSTVLTSPNTSGSLIIGTWDINCFTMVQPYTSLPTTSNRGCFSTNGAGLQHTYGIDWASSSPSTLVSLTDNQQGYTGGTYTNYSGISSNGGSTWPTALQAPSSVTSGGDMGGCIAAASPTNVMWSPTDGSGGGIFPLFTTNAGASATYSSVTISGTTTGGWPYTQFAAPRQCAADRVLSNAFYLFNWNNGTNNSFVKCTASGASCATQSSFSLPASAKFIPIMKTMPGQSGTFFFSYAISTPFADNSNYGFYWSNTGGTSKTQITGWTMVAAYGFGATISGHTMPSIVAVGFYNHVWGIYESDDWDSTQTWQQIGTYPMGLPVTINDVDGDKTIPHVWYYGSNSGVFCSAQSTAYCGNAF
jgi:xyloglucan-specific exo-beta-1,4-glucanase